MISKVRLQRKFNSKSKFNYIEQIMLVIRILIVFELSIILLTCLFNLSLDFHIEHIFVCQFWTNTQVVRYNIALLVTSILFCPYLIYVEHVKVLIVKDCYFTVLILHSFFGLLHNLQFELDYLIFVVSLGYLTSSGTQYLAMVMEQKKLIEEINEIESEDRKQIQDETLNLQQHKFKKGNIELIAQFVWFKGKGMSTLKNKLSSQDKPCES